MSALNTTARRLNRDLEAVASAVKRANNSVNRIENGLSALGKRVLAAKRRREEMLRGTHNGQVRNHMKTKQGGSRRIRKGRRGSTRRK